MKKTLISAILVLIVMASVAQNSQTSTHLMFKGVQIDGTLAGYTLLMEKSGLNHVQTEDGIALLKGDFAGYKGCLVGVATQKRKDLVSKITVFFPEQTT